MARSAPEAPAGDVTFVFSDIEGSTALFRRLPERYPVLLEVHRTILRAAWQRFDGYEVGTDGDSFFVAFADPTKAVHACLAAQRGLAEHHWDDDAEIRVRMGAHRGRAVPRSGDYVALSVHQAARVASGANGAQVLLTSSVVDAIPPADCPELEPLGRWRVKDFEEPVELWCLIDERAGLARLEPNLVPAVGHNLIRPLDTLFGRSSDLDAVSRAIQPQKLVTIVGPGGVGKTRIAIEVGLRDTDEWPDGVWFVPLDSIGHDDEVPHAITSVVGRHGGASTDEPWSTTLNGLRRRRSLLILDNCEHVAGGVAAAVADILSQCDSVALVATSRQPLGPSAATPLGERVIRLDPLTTTSAGDVPPAAAMFVERAGMTDDRLGPDTITAVVELCGQLDGLPLAIELAASWVDMLTPAEIASALLEPGTELDARDRRRTDRHRTITRALDWSYESLDEVARAALRRVSVFAGDFSLAAATSVLGDDDVTAGDVRLVLHDLVSKSLLHRARADERSRFGLLRTIRTYADGHCTEAERIGALRRLAGHYAAVLGPERCLDRSWPRAMAAELDNIRAVVSADVVDLAVRRQLVWSLGQYLDLTDQFVAGLSEIQRHTVAGDDDTSVEQVGLLTLGADLAIRIGDFELARTYCDRAAAAATIHGSPEWDDAGLWRAQAALALWDGDVRRCAETAERGLHAGLSTRGTARLFDVRGIARVQLGDMEGAADDFLAELGLWTELGSDTKICTTHGNLAEVYLQLGDHVAAARHQLACLELAREFGFPVLVANSMVMAAHLAAAHEDWSVVVSLQRAADLEIERLGFVRFDFDLDARDDLLARAAAELGRSAVDESPGDLGEVDRERFYELAEQMFRSTLSGANR